MVLKRRSSDPAGGAGTSPAAPLRRPDAGSPGGSPLQEIARAPRRMEGKIHPRSCMPPSSAADESTRSRRRSGPALERKSGRSTRSSGRGTLRYGSEDPNRSRDMRDRHARRSERGDGGRHRNSDPASWLPTSSARRSTVPTVRRWWSHRFRSRSVDRRAGGAT